MALSVNIYGTLIHAKDPAQAKSIEDWGYPDDPKMQYWRRRDLPDYYDDVAYDEDKNVLLNKEQREYAAIEVDRCLNGFWFYNNGVATYITGKNYFYLQWWYLEDGIFPDYRDADRRYFLFLDYWERILWCIGVFRGKKRREGASSQATSNLIYECIFYKNSNCGLVSKTQDDSKATFLEMVANGYRELPVFLKPRQLNREDSVTEFVFAAKAGKGEVTVKGNKGNKSKINYKAPVENAYDRGRISRLLADEGGKWPKDVKFSKFISKVTKTMIKGAKRVGFCEAPSTVNELTKAGGAEFKRVWDNANQFKSNNKKTLNRFVTYFTPAYDNYEGFIDQYGMSVIDAPTEEQFQYLVTKWVVKDPITGDTTSEISEEDIRLGSKAYIMSRRVGLKDDDLEEEIRQNPCTVQEMFEAANTDCVFNSYNINQRKKELDETPPYRRKIIYYRDLDQKVKWRDVNKGDGNFYWEQTWILDSKEANKSIGEGIHKKPGRTEDGAIAIDSYSNSQGGRKYGSKACALMGRRSDLLDPQNTGKPVGMLYGRPNEKDKLHEQVLLAAEYNGFLAWYEHTADDYDGYFKDRGMTGYLGKYPLSLIDPTKRTDAERYRGTPITPFSLTKQLDNGIAFFQNHCDKIDYIEICDNALIFDATDRTKYDILVSFLILISVLQERPIKPPPRKTPLVNIYENPNYGGNSNNGNVTWN